MYISEDSLRQLISYKWAHAGQDYKKQIKMMRALMDKKSKPVFNFILREWKRIEREFDEREKDWYLENVGEYKSRETGQMFYKREGE